MRISRLLSLKVPWQSLKVSSYKNLPAEEDPEVHLGQLKRFSLQELQVATDNFSNRNILDVDNFGYEKVYKGRLADGSLVIVKQFKNERKADDVLRFQTELEVSMAVHRNLLRLRGFCMTPTGWFLVYPYMANGSVASCLRERDENTPPLTWSKRRRIALGVARGMSYLHHCDPKIILRDVKALNILLDEDFEAVVGNFGLALLMDSKDTHVTTDMVAGTYGHIAPEYFQTNKTSEKSDVYGYGIMLLELITRQQAHVKLEDDFCSLPNWVKKHLKEKELNIIIDPDLIDPDLDNFIDIIYEVESLIQIALLCTQDSPLGRPKMSEVVRMLEGDSFAERCEEWQKVEAVRIQTDLVTQQELNMYTDSD